MASTHPLSLLVSPPEKSFHDKIRVVKYRHNYQNSEFYSLEETNYLGILGHVGCHNENIFVKVDSNGKPEKWYFSEHRDSVDLKTAYTFERVWSERFQLYFVIDSGYKEDLKIVEEDDAGKKCISDFFHYEDFALRFTSKKNTSVDEPKVYVRNERTQFFRFWIKHIIRANEESKYHFPVTEDIDTLQSVKKELTEIINGNTSPIEQYGAIRAMVINYDLISSESRANYFP